MTDRDRLLRTAADLLRLGPRRPLIHPPERYDGPLYRLVEEHVLPNLPAADDVAAFHEALVRYVEEPGPLLLVRYGGAMERRSTYRTRDGLPVKATDNSPVWFLHWMLLQQVRVAPGAMRQVLDGMPAHFHDVQRLLPMNANAAGWHFAHVFDVKDRNNDPARWDREDAVARFVRHLHPCNVFLVPKAGWQRTGGDRRIIGWFAALHARRYGRVWEEFVRLARVDTSRLARPEQDVRISYAPSERTSHLGSTKRTEQTAGAPATYRFSRLAFKRDVIEPLEKDHIFRIETARDGTFEMTKADFYRVFPNVVASASYREDGLYHFPKPPRRALPFRVESEG